MNIRKRWEHRRQFSDCFSCVIEDNKTNERYDLLDGDIDAFIGEINKQYDKLEAINKVINWVYGDNIFPSSNCSSEALDKIKNILAGVDLE